MGAASMNEQLKAKLREILGENVVAYEGGGQLFFRLDPTINLIDQAYKEAGYIKLSAVTPETQAAIANIVLGNKVMTGQEWFDRFEQQFLSDNVNHKTYEPKKIEWTNVLKAARKAAGIDE